MTEIKYLQLLKCHPINYGYSVNRICANKLVNNPLICTETMSNVMVCAVETGRAKEKCIELI